MNKRKKNSLLVLIYSVTLFVCFGIVTIIGRLSAPSPDKVQTSEPVTMEVTEGETKESETEPSLPDLESQTTQEEMKESIVESKTEIPADQTTETEEVYKPPSIVIATDVHYYSPDLTDYGQAFWTMAKGDDGKVVQYIPELMDSFTRDMEELKPSAVILSGDLTLNGEKRGHEALAKKLKVLEEKGVKVLVIPGNHDINNYNSASYMGKEREPSDIVTPEDFYRIYRSFGYDQAISQDEASFSYVYELDEYNWLLMLDSAQYEPENKVGGRIREKTLAWMKTQLEEAKKRSVNVITIAHHNLLKESIRYPVDCTLENSEEVIQLLESYRVPLYISGHLHLQRTKTHKPRPGAPIEGYHISEVVADSLAISPFQYGVLKWTDNNGLFYTSKELDVGKWAKDQQVTDDNLLKFREYGADFLMEVVSSQVYEKLKNLPEEQRNKMAGLYSDINRAYCAGIPVDAAWVKSEEAYRLWERNLPDSRLFAEMNEMIRDTGHDYNTWECVLEYGRRNDGIGNDSSPQS
jgi:3',5'-cyclic AMP phosphodiesterase CpdA